MPQVSAIQGLKYQPAAVQPNYNAVKVDINNPQVNAPASQSQGMPVYSSIPEVSAYEIPQKSIYYQPQSVQGGVSVPPPVIVQPSVNQKPEAAEPKTIEVQASKPAVPQIDLNEFLSKLTSPNYDEQLKAMEFVRDKVQMHPEEATQLLEVKVIDALLGIMNKDSSKLEGPTLKQLQIREKIMSGKKVTEAEAAEANKVTPMELAERNKVIAIYTVVILQKLYTSEIEKISNVVVPLTELPGAAGIVEQIKNNPNPMVRAASIEALSYIQRPEYKQDLTTLFTVAKNDKDLYVQKAAEEALKRLKEISDLPAPEQKTPATQKAV